MKKTIRILILLFLSINAHSQKVSKSKKIGGLLIGGNAPMFYRNDEDIIQLPSKDFKKSWQVGASVDLIHTKLYAFRWELVYNNKGAKELFQDAAKNQIVSDVNLSYVQANVFPLIIMPLRKPKFNPFVALGGYYSYLAKSKYKSQYIIKGLAVDIKSDEISKISLKEDYGVAASLGFYIKAISLEYRVERGIPFLLDPSKTLSSIKNNNHALILTIR